MARKKSSTGLVTSLSIWTTVPVILVLLVMGGSTLWVLGNRVTMLVEDNAAHTMKMMERIVNTEVDGAVKNYLRAVAEKNRDLMNFFYQEAQKGKMSERAAYERIREIFLDPEYGQIGTTSYLAGVTSSGVLEIHPVSPGVDASDFDFMQKAMEMKNGYLEYEWQNVGEKKARLKAGYLSYFEPWDIMVWASSYKSEFYSLIDQSSLDQRVSSISIDETGYVVIRNSDKKIIAGKDSLNLLNETPAGKASQTVVETTNGKFRIDTKIQENTGWQISVVSPLSPYNQLLWLLRAIIGLSIVASGVLLHFVIRYLLNRKLAPLKSMRRLAERVSQGDLTGRIQNLSDDEIGEVGLIFNHIITEFSGVLSNIKSVIHVLSESIQNLSTSAQEIASTSNEQAAAVKEILSTMEDADQVSKDNMEKIEEVARIANKTKENVEEGFELIKTSLSKMEEIRTTNSDTIVGIKTLGERITSIWEIVNIINNIADQTKIIAFNAELEAAAAGDAGKNFQIVAGEIRRLADSTVNSTNEIKGKINEIQHASDKLIVASEEGTRRITEGWDISTNIRGIFEEVLNSSEISAHSADEITRSTKMQVSSFEQIFTTLKQISESIDSFVESTNYTNQVSDHLTEITESFGSEIDGYTVEEEKEE
ncbi:MAG: cache domain-containing protein [Spirochaetales bacterium]|nr:cache domain-containing protein [Spirochaetales bacterium]MCF7938502.1 cache domain-containing protein [Spirochaetales bacterium]